MAVCALGAVLTPLLIGSSPSDDAARAWTKEAEAAEAEVRAEVEAYYRNLSARDWKAFADHFWPGADIATVWTPPGEAGPRVAVTPVPEFVERAPEGPGSREVFEEWPIRIETRVEGGLAQAWVRYGARFGDPGEIAEWQGIDAFTLLRHEGRWRITELAFASDHGEEAEASGADGASGEGAEPAGAVPDSAADAEAIRAAQRVLDERSRRAEWREATALYTDDIVMMPPGVPTLEGKDAVLRFHESLPGAPEGGTDLVEIVIRGDVAYVRGLYDLRMEGADGTVRDETGKFIEIWRRAKDGRWLLARDIFNSDRGE